MLLSVAFTVTTLFLTCIAHPPFGPQWRRVRSTPVLPPTLPWEHNCTCENVATYDPSAKLWKMWYRGGWDVPVLGYATSTDGLQWVKHPTPIFGFPQGIGGQPWVLLPEYYLYTTNNTMPGAQVVISISHDKGLSWTILREGTVPSPPGGSYWGNRVVWRTKENSSSSYSMLQEVMMGGTWQIFLYNSSDAIRWTLLNNGEPLTTLQRAPGSMYGGPRFSSEGGVLKPKFSDGMYHLWYHATNVTGGSLPTDIYHATSTDLVHWDVTPNTPVVSHLGGNTYEHDQVAGPVVVGDGNSTYHMYFDGDNNVIGSCAIGVVVFP
eukprot:PhF_6_TR28118/c0_g1_i1/m.41595